MITIIHLYTTTRAIPTTLERCQSEFGINQIFKIDNRILRIKRTMNDV